MSKLKIVTTATIAAISAEHGMVHWMNFSKSVNTDKFMEFLEKIEKMFKKKSITLFMDNLRVHHTNRVKNFCHRNDI